MKYDPREILEEFSQAMADIKKTVPGQYEAFIREKEAITKGGKLEEKTKWLLLLVSSVSQKCPVCIPRAVEHCLRAGWKKEEMLEACMVAVLIGGSSVMTYAALADKSIEQLEKK